MIVLMSVRPARMNRRRKAVTSATIASRIGMNAATNVRKTTSSTMIAASRPSSSDVPCSIGGNSASPLYSTVTPTGSTASRTMSCDGDDRLAILVEDHAVELRLGVGDPAVVGEGVVARTGRRRSSGPAVSSVGANSSVSSRAIAALIAASRWGVSSRSPSGAAKTRLSTPPCSSRTRPRSGPSHAACPSRDLELVAQAAADGGDERRSGRRRSRAS